MKEKTKMNKKVMIAGLAVITLCLLTGLFWYVGTMNGAEQAVNQETTMVAQETVTVPVITVEETKEIKSSDFAEIESLTLETEESIQETQVEEPSENSVAEDLKPVIKTEAVTRAAKETKPQMPEQAVSPTREPESQEVKPEHDGEPPVPENSAPEGGTSNDQGKVYVPGFGYVDGDGKTTSDQAHSDGDWDKQVGSMQ